MMGIKIKRIAIKIWLPFTTSVWEDDAPVQVSVFADTEEAYYRLSGTISINRELGDLLVRKNIFP